MRNLHLNCFGEVRLHNTIRLFFRHKDLLRCYQVQNGGIFCSYFSSTVGFYFSSSVSSFLVSYFFPIRLLEETYRLLVDPNPELSCLVDEKDELADDVEGPVQPRPEFPSPLS